MNSDQQMMASMAYNQQLFNQVNGGLYQQIFLQQQQLQPGWSVNSATGQIQGELKSSGEVKAASASEAYKPKANKKYDEGESLLQSIMKNSKYPYNPFARTIPQEQKSASNLKLNIVKSATPRQYHQIKRSADLQNRSIMKPREGIDDYLDDEGTEGAPGNIDLSSLTSLKMTTKERDAMVQSITDNIRLHVIFEQKDEPQRIFSFEGKINQRCGEIKMKTLEKMFGSEVKHPEKYKLIVRNLLVSDRTKIKDADLRNNDRVYLVEDESYEYDSDEREYSPQIKKKKEREYAPEAMIPKLTKPGYSTVPSLVQLSRMTEDELAAVEEFQVMNEHAKAIWEGKTDVRYLDLDKLVEFGPKSVEVYPNRVGLPELGKGLNKTAVIRFYNWAMPKKYRKFPELYREKIVEWAKGYDATLQYYEPKEGVVCIRVPHFQAEDRKKE